MKEYRVETEKISTVSATMVQKHLTDNAKWGWILKQVVINEATDEYLIIFEKDY